MESSFSISDSQFMFTYLTHPLRHSLHKIADFIEKAPDVCVLKDAKTRKYLEANRFEEEHSGIKKEDLIGLTIEDLNFGHLEGSKDSLVNMIKEIAERVNVNKLPVLSKDILLTHDGFIRIKNMITMPVLGCNDKNIAILSYEEDLTQKENPFELFNLYKRHYLPKQAVEQFLGYFNVKTCFNENEMPKNSEVQVLIAMSLDTSHKQVAERLKISPRTVDCHACVINSKLKEHVTLSEVLRRMRSKWIPLPVH